MAIGVRAIQKALGTTGGLVGFGANAAIMAGMHKMEGDSLPVAAAKGIGEQLMWEAAGGFGTAIMLTQMAGMVGGAAYEIGRTNYNRNVYDYYTPGRLGGNYIDTQQALTMRQAAIQNLQQSRVNGRLVLGNEASFLHR
jgi:hypothetical protein